MAVGAAVAWPALSPLLGGSDADSFPLSTYPMFTRDRGRVVELATVVGVGEAGRTRLSPELIAGTDQVMLAVTVVQRAVSDGDVGTRALCTEVAGRIDDAEIDEVEVVVERHDLDQWPDAAEPVGRRVVARCEVTT